MENIKVSLIVSFYNQIEYLKLIFAALGKQTFRHFEVIIADDGSGKDVVDDIKKLAAASSFFVQHIWHEDKGWRKNIILNKSVQSSRADYLVFLDGDCIPHPSFIEEHYINREKRVFLAGRRVNLSRYISNHLSERKIKTGYLERWFLFVSFFLRLFGKGTHIENGIYIKSKYIRRKINRKDKGILGSNFSLFKSDLLDVNGFDERYLHPAVGEDSDLEYRLRLNGMRSKPVKHLAIQYHLYHKRLPRQLENFKIFEETKVKRISYTPFGINKNVNSI